MLDRHSSQVFYTLSGSILLKRNITLSDLFKSTNLEYLDSTSWKKRCLKFYINCIRIKNEFHSLLYLTSKVDIIILRFSGILGRWYLSVLILNLWLLDRNFAPAWRCFSFLIRSKYSDLLTSALKVEFIEIQVRNMFIWCFLK